ncbi:hypothetical protein [Arthrobacter pityocampae]|uniref:hypothetical protein n=1 Tax=Arthrobacter pityocampae TaxID=547334 RepID=UPI00373549D5
MSEELVRTFIAGLVLGGPAWILCAVGIFSVKEGCERLERWWKYSPPQRERFRRHKKRERLAKKLEAMR